MKKAKIMLSAIAVMAVVGGGLAFKASKFNGDLFCSNVKGGSVTTVTTYSFEATSTLKLYCIPSIDLPTTTSTTVSIPVEINE